jgi:hypothetical protein
MIDRGKLNVRSAIDNQHLPVDDLLPHNVSQFNLRVKNVNGQSFLLLLVPQIFRQIGLLPIFNIKEVFKLFNLLLDIFIDEIEAFLVKLNFLLDA